MWLKKFLAVFLTTLCFCTSVSLPTFADVPEAYFGGGIAPMYEIAESANSWLDISDYTATCRSKTNSSGAASITVEQTLQKRGLFGIWTKYDNCFWTKTVSSSSIYALNSKSGLANGKYRLKSVFTLTNSAGRSETITVYSTERTVG